ncbi:(2Fe-2S)-binding protein [Plantactinospora sp. GCM10030261]|uniref:(2Fe-2S)-binding protein n=1 Tax=Plantactinospora sp. GCM10030261 TaxID=3273420 RepID=UPI0036060022
MNPEHPTSPAPRGVNQAGAAGPAGAAQAGEPAVLRLNGRAVAVTASPVTPLLDVLRDEVGDTSPKPGCREGRCGSCTVLLDGAPVLSCLLPLGRALDGEVTTVAGADRVDAPPLREVREAFARAGAVQCGICTPGMILAGAAVLAERPDASRREIRRGLVNNMCRCTGYTKIIDALESVARPAESDRG